LLGVDAGVLIIIDDQLRAQAFDGERGHEIFQEGRFSGSEKSYDENEWSHFERLRAARGYFLPVSSAVLRGPCDAESDAGAAPVWVVGISRRGHEPLP
jgi:hypothetical protein